MRPGRLRLVCALTTLLACRKEEAVQVPEVLREFYAPDIALEGFWRRAREPGYAYSLMHVQKEEEGRYSMIDLNAMDCGCIKRSLRGVWSGGALRVEDSTDFPRALHPVRVGGLEGLLAEELLPALEQVMGKGTDWSESTLLFRTDEDEYRSYEKFCIWFEDTARTQERANDER